jgi:hypothetical protein
VRIPSNLPRLESKKRFIGQLDHVPDTTDNERKRKRAHSPDTTGTSGPADLEETEFDTDEMTQVPKRLRRIAGRSASLPTTAVAVRSRRAERQARADAAA